MTDAKPNAKRHVNVLTTVPDYPDSENAMSWSLGGRVFLPGSCMVLGVLVADLSHGRPSCIKSSELHS